MLYKKMVVREKVQIKRKRGVFMFTPQVIKLIILFAYLLGMLLIGLLSFKNTQEFQDYILGGRKLGKWATALSAQASDMSGWLLLGLPSAAYLAGVEAGWIAVGLGIGTYANWKIVAKRLRIYTEKTGNALTLPEYFKARFEDKSNLLSLVPALVIIAFFTVYTSAQFSTGAKLFEMLLGIPYQTALVLGCLVIIGYTFLGGFFAVSITDVIQGMLMFFALIIVPFVAIAEMGGFAVVGGKLAAVDPNFLSMFQATGSAGMVPILSIITNLAWGLGYFGQPHILVRFMAIKEPNDLKYSRRIATVWVTITLIASIAVGVLGRVFFAQALTDSEQVFMHMSDLLFPAAIAGVFLAAILAASMSTADSQLLVTAASIAEDVYRPFFDKKASDKKLLNVGRISVAVIALVAMFIAFDPNSSVFGLVSNAWAGLGAAFGPVVLLSLFWKRMNRIGAAAGMISGAVVVAVWNALESALPNTDIFSLYELLPAFLISLLCIVVFSLLTKEPSASIVETFNEVAGKETAAK